MRMIPIIRQLKEFVAKGSFQYRATQLLFETICCKSAEFSRLKLIVIEDSACLSIIETQGMLL